MSYSNGPQIATDGLIMYLDGANRKSYPGSGNNWADLSGNNNAGTLENTPTFSGNSGGSILLDGVNEYVQLPSVSNTTTRTVDIVYKLENYTTGWGPLWRDDWRERIFPGSINIINANGTYYYLYVPPSDNSLVHITYSYNGTTIKGYKNGILLDTQTMNGPMNTGNYTYRSGYQCGGATCTYVNMYLYNLKFYNRALSDNEVLQNYNATKTRFGL